MQPWQQQQQQQQQEQPVAHFYAQLVQLQATPLAAAPSPRDGPAEQQQGLGWGGAAAAAHARSRSRSWGSAAAAPHEPRSTAHFQLKPVKFAEPVVLDPNTGILTVPPKAQAADTHAQTTAAAAEPLHPKHAQSATRAAAFDRGGSSSSSNLAAQLHAWQQHPSSPAATGSSYKRPIDRSNVGYRLLSKAGWKEGQGLGAQEQGMSAPLQVVPQKGNLGLGFTKAKQQHQQHQQQQESSQQQQQQPAAGPVLGSKRVAALVAAELAAEDRTTKVQRHRQVMLQEARDKRGKAVQSYLYRAFNEPSTAELSDSNPLVKNHRLTATNPLLDDD